jgi:hypothetical protein
MGPLSIDFYDTRGDGGSILTRILTGPTQAVTDNSLNPPRFSHHGVIKPTDLMNNTENIEGTEDRIVVGGMYQMNHLSVMNNIKMTLSTNQPVNVK